MATEKRLIDATDWDSFYADMGDSRNTMDSYDRGYTDALDRVDDWMDAQPTVDAVEVVHGHWEKAHDDLGIDRGWKCSCCKGSVYEMTYEPYQHCPHCGAKMDGDGNA